MIRHIVAVKFNDGTSSDIKQGIYADLAKLSGHIDGISDFQSRANVSVEDELVRGFRDLFWFDFKDESVRDAYLVDSVHQSIGKRIVDNAQGGIDGIFVFDIEV
ncbi:Dabb family protein [Pacificoceanicola onchidii]|uniref:Dabb family protein n=1 Tax=Pacificoceanicola onchidii TaxID=2562685 RepID=UPI0010A67DA6|nr:Dabb family protein [Pacificoceanicola onchidii]